MSNFSRIYHQNQRADKRRAQKVSRKQNTAKNAISQKSEINVFKLINLEVCTIKKENDTSRESQKRTQKFKEIFHLVNFLLGILTINVES